MECIGGSIMDGLIALIILLGLLLVWHENAPLLPV
jgi:hypothetical protein